MENKDKNKDEDNSRAAAKISPETLKKINLAGQALAQRIQLAFNEDELIEYMLFKIAIQPNLESMIIDIKSHLGSRKIIEILRAYCDTMELTRELYERDSGDRTD